VDEDQGGINDALFAVIMDSGYGMNDLPTRVHKTGYPLSFADGHAEAFKFFSKETSEISSDGTVNRDVINLRNAAYISW
jgi:prepilin-type processing-associated H-X9-DG protein